MDPTCLRLVWGIVVFSSLASFATVYCISRSLYLLYYQAYLKKVAWNFYRQIKLKFNLEHNHTLNNKIYKGTTPNYITSWWKMLPFLHADCVLLFFRNTALYFCNYSWKVFLGFCDYTFYRNTSWQTLIYFYLITNGSWKWPLYYCDTDHWIHETGN